ncbi:MAG: hypothetical protein RR374_07180, partial [Clostridia bacterium]
EGSESGHKTQDGNTKQKTKNKNKNLKNFEEKQYEKSISNTGIDARRRIITGCRHSCNVHNN